MNADRNTPKSIQMPSEAFIRLARYFLLDERSEGLERQITQDITAKLDALMKRQLYSDYKTALTDQDRETARQKYLDHVGMLDSFRWSDEQDRANRKT